jgi:hypothetical protein
VAHAEQIFRDLLGLRSGDAPAPTPHAFLEAVRRFSLVGFEVPDDADSDGFLFAYGAYRHLPGPGFIVTVVRQLEVCDESGNHGCYLQLHGQYLCSIEPDLEALGHKGAWWFRGDPTQFDEWFSAMTNDPVWHAIGNRPFRFTVWQDSV